MVCLCVPEAHMKHVNPSQFISPVITRIVVVIVLHGQMRYGTKKSGDLPPVNHLGLWPWPAFHNHAAVNQDQRDSRPTRLLDSNRNPS